MLQVNIKKLSDNAVIPTYAKDGDAGMDLTAVSKFYDDDGNVCYGVGLAFEIPCGYFAQLLPRSSNAKKDLVLSNSVGVLDSGYRGEVMFKFKPCARYEELLDGEFRINDWYDDNKQYEICDRIGQIIIMPYPKIEFIEVDELSGSERGAGGFGSSGV